MTGPRLLDRVRAAIQNRQCSYGTEQAYVHSVRRLMLYHDRRPSEMSGPWGEGSLTHVALERRDSASARKRALSAIPFLYTAVLERGLDGLDGVVRAKRTPCEPVVLTPEAVRSVIGHLRGPCHLMARRLYGGGLRLRECLRLRIKVVDFRYRQITVQERLGHRSAEMTMVYTQVLQRGGLGVHGPADVVGDVVVTA